MIGHSLLFFAAVACPTMIVLSLIPIKNGEAIHKQADSNNHIFKATSHFSHHLTIRGGPNQQPPHRPPTQNTTAQPPKQVRKHTSQQSTHPTFLAPYCLIPVICLIKIKNKNKKGNAIQHSPSYFQSLETFTTKVSALSTD